MVNKSKLPIFSSENVLYFIAVMLFIIVGICLIIFVSFRYSLLYNISKLKCDVNIVTTQC
jgi:cell division protein FtsL